MEPSRGDLEGKHISFPDEGQQRNEQGRRGLFGGNPEQASRCLWQDWARLSEAQGWLQRRDWAASVHIGWFYPWSSEMCPPTSAAHSGTGLDRVKEVKMVTKVEVGEFQEPPVWPGCLWAAHAKDGSGPIPCHVSGYLKINHYWSTNLHWRPLKNHSGCPWLLFRMGDKGLFPFTPDEILGSRTEAFISESKSQSLVRELGIGERWESRHRKDWHQATETLTMCQRELCSWNDGGSLCSSSPTTPHPPEQNSRANRSLKNGREKGRPATETKPKLCVCFIYMYSTYYSTTVESN